MQTVHNLIVTPLRCKACGVCQQWALPAEERLRDVLETVACFGCSLKGQLFLSASQTRRLAANG